VDLGIGSTRPNLKCYGLRDALEMGIKYHLYGYNYHKVVVYHDRDDDGLPGMCIFASSVSVYYTVCGWWVDLCVDHVVAEGGYFYYINSV